MTAHYRQSFVAALIGHFLLILAAVLVSVLPGCRRAPPPDLSAFKDVDIRNLDSTTKLERKKPPTENVNQPPPPPAPPSPVMPADPVPPKPPPPEPKPSKPAPAEDDDGPAPLERTPPRDRPAPVQSNAAPARPAAVPVKVSTIKTTRFSASTATGPVRSAQPRLLTPGELDPLGGIKAPLGNSNSVPLAERDRCLLLIRRALYDAWDRPTLADAGRQPALLQVRFDAGGRIMESALVQSSGSAVMDGTVRLAARNAAPVTGLSAGFLKEYARGLTVEFVVTE
jgi:outer membrane biosynthesis protein TonB